MNMLFLLNLFLFVFLSISVANGSIVCDNEDECSYETIEEDNIYCRGFRACRYDTIEGSDFISCGGQKGCEYSDITTDTGSIYCDGWLGCWQSTITVSEDGVIECRGRRTCYGSVIEASEITTVCSGGYSCDASSIESDTVDCNGLYACTNAEINAQTQLNIDGERGAEGATITSTPIIYTHGYYAMQDAYVSSEGIDSLTISSDGDYSLSDAELACYDGSVCSVICGAGNTCEDFTYTCYGDAECNLDCDDECSECPSITYESSSTSMSSSRFEKHEKLRKENIINTKEKLEVAITNEEEKELVDVNNINNINIKQKPKQFNIISWFKNSKSIFRILIQLIAIVAIYEMIKIFINKFLLCNNNNNKKITDNFNYINVKSYNSI